MTSNLFLQGSGKGLKREISITLGHGLDVIRHVLHNRSNLQFVFINFPRYGTAWIQLVSARVNDMVASKNTSWGVRKPRVFLGR